MTLRSTLADTSYNDVRQLGESTMTTSIISSKGQIVIPAAVRSDMQAEAGMRVEFVKVAEGWLLKAASKPVTSLKGMVAKPKRRVTVEDMNRSIRAHAARATK